MHKNQINPSSDFSRRTIQRALEVKQKRDTVLKAWVCFLMFMPFILRQVWLFVRHDYFSTAGLPFHEIIISTYSFMISNMAYYALLGISVIAASMYFWGKQRLSLAAKSLGQIFSQAIAKI